MTYLAVRDIASWPGGVDATSREISRSFLSMERTGWWFKSNGNVFEPEPPPRLRRFGCFALSVTAQPPSGQEGRWPGPPVCCCLPEVEGLHYRISNRFPRYLSHRVEYFEYAFCFCPHSSTDCFAGFCSFRFRRTEPRAATGNASCHRP